MNKPYAVLAFVTGALLGVSVTGTVLRIKYMKDLEREIDSVIEEFSKQPRVIFKDKKEELVVKAEDVELLEKAKIMDEVIGELDTSKGFYYSPENEKSGKLYNVHGEEIILNEDGVCEEEYEDELPPLTEDDVVVYDKISPTSRIDVFDAAVFATIRMLIDTGKAADAAAWFGDD